jgi:ribosome-associated translation inhibitor RaiA
MIQIHAKNFELLDFDKEQLQKKAEKLIHLAREMGDESTVIKLDYEIISKAKHLVGGALTISLPGDVLRAEAQAEKNLLTVWDQLEKEIRPQIEKYKGKHRH